MEKIFELFDTSLRKRTDGDGMESAASDSASEIEVDAQFNIPRKKSSDSLVKTKSRLIELTPPNLAGGVKKNYYAKEAKFIPYEPYKAAVKPMVPNAKIGRSSKKKPSKNNLDLSVLVAQMSLMDTKPVVYKKSTLPRVIPSMSKANPAVKETRIVNAEMEKENNQLRDELKTMRSEHESLNEQLKQQVQVNKELKTMLVASMGEDLETRVQSLTEDKRQLASALLNSAQHLSTHQEQTEWLAGQCEVWRSKFLASSLMVEELANWKALLSQRTDELQLIMRQLLEERCRVRDMLLYMYKNMRQMHENWLENVAVREINYGSARSIGNINLNTSKLASSNIIDLASVNLKLSENLCSSVDRSGSIENDSGDLKGDTDAEMAAEKILATPLVLNSTNLPFSALVGHAYKKSGGTPTVACCVQCNGQIQSL